MSRIRLLLADELARQKPKIVWLGAALVWLLSTISSTLSCIKLLKLRWETWAFSGLVGSLAATYESLVHQGWQWVDGTRKNNLPSLQAIEDTFWRNVQFALGDVKLKSDQFNALFCWVRG